MGSGHSGHATVLEEVVSQVLGVHFDVVLLLDGEPEEQTSAAHLLDERRLDLFEFGFQQLTHLLRVLYHALLHEGLDSRMSSGHSEVVASKGAAMLSRAHMLAHIIVYKDATHR